MSVGGFFFFSNEINSLKENSVFFERPVFPSRCKPGYWEASKCKPRYWDTGGFVVLIAGLA